jgi:hypothetical protein
MTDDELEKAVRAGLRAAAQQPAPDSLVARAAAIPRTTARAVARPRWVQFAGGIAAAAAAVVVLALAVSLLPLGTGPVATGTPSPTSSVSAAPKGSAAASPVVTAEASTAPSISAAPNPGAFQSGGFTWTLVGGDQFGGASLDTVTATHDGGWLGFGRAQPTVTDYDGGPDSSVWVSSDGESWSRSPGSSVLAATTKGWNAVALDVARVSGGYMAVGMDQAGDASGANASAWYSTDGAHWTRAVVADRAGRTMDQLIVTKDGLVALGEARYSFHAGMGDGTAIWTSSDGRSWTLLPAKDGPPVGTRISRVIATADGYLAIAAFEYGWGPSAGVSRQPVTAGIWRSADAIHWTPVAASPVGVADLGVVGSGSTLVAVGSGGGDLSQPALAWQSSDGGRTWSDGSLPTPPGLAAGVAAGVMRVVSASSGLLALGELTDDYNTMVAWSSPDGVAWSTEPLTLPQATTLENALVLDGAVLIEGETLTDTGSVVPETWLVTPVARTSPPTAPAPAESPSPIAASPPASADSAAAFDLATRWETARANGDFAQAWDLLSADSQATVGSPATFEANEAAYNAAGGTRFVIQAPSQDPAMIANFLGADQSRIEREADMTRGWLVFIQHPDVAGASAGTAGLFVAPLMSGQWRVWMVH